MLPWGHEENRFSVEFFHILIAKVFIMVVFEDFKAIGGLELSIVEGFKRNTTDVMEESHRYKQNDPYFLNHYLKKYQRGDVLRIS